MCGIIGYVGSRECKPLLIQGLERLEYRGYDSSGLALLESDGLDYVRAVGVLDNLKARAGSNSSVATTGLGHTRWATHGGVSEANAHPLAGCDPSKVSIVLNGIVENYRELKESLGADGHTFTSDTDAETVTHLIERHYDGDLGEAVRLAFGDLEGHFAFVVIHRDHPGMLVGARHQVPLVVGVGQEEMFLASNAAAFLRETRTVQFPGDGEIVTVRPEGATFQRVDGSPVVHGTMELDWDDEGAEKAGFETFMLKEIYEQPDAVAETIGDRVRHGTLVLEGLDMSGKDVKELRRIVLLACGTAYHACVVGRYVIEEWARIPVEFDIASEWVYRNPVINERDLVIGITQSGETADTIGAVKAARLKGCPILAVTNVVGSALAREATGVLQMHAGPEIGVASTKAFSTMIVAGYLLGLWLGRQRGALTAEDVKKHIQDLVEIPRLVEKTLELDTSIAALARHLSHATDFLYLGRGVQFPIALEGALKLKEISYIPTEAYSAGEMKHGPIALLDEETPVVVVATDSHVYDKVVSNIQEVRARGAEVVAIATDGNEDIQHHADDVVFVPRTHPFLQAALAVIPLQLIAYRIARLRGMNVDQPRNLAKTVTVE